MPITAYARLALPALLVRTLALAAVWWVLAGGDLASWAIGAPVVALALWTSVRLAPPPVLRFSLIGAVGFFAFFVLQSLKGGLQVAMMALRPKLDLRPGELELTLRLAPGPGQMLLAAALCLMPGTLVTAVESSRLRLHVLDRRMPIEHEVRAAERWIARMLRERLA